LWPKMTYRLTCGSSSHAPRAMWLRDTGASRGNALLGCGAKRQLPANMVRSFRTARPLAWQVKGSPPALHVAARWSDLVR
jgi:hypothetical protein